MTLREIYEKLDVTRFRVRRITSNQDYLITGTIDPVVYNLSVYFSAFRLEASMPKAQLIGNDDCWTLLSSKEELIMLNSLPEHEVYTALRRGYS